MVLENFTPFISQWGYLAVFIASFINSSTILLPILPFPSYLPIIIGVGLGLNPFITGVSGGLGSVLGDSIAYFVGFGGTAAIQKFEKKLPRFLRRFEKYYSNIGFWVVLTFALLPLPFDIIGIMSGVSRYDIRKFLAALFIGRMVRSLIVAYLVFTGSAVIDMLYDIFYR